MLQTMMTHIFSWPLFSAVQFHKCHSSSRFQYCSPPITWPYTQPQCHTNLSFIRVIQQYMTAYGLGDSWRARNTLLRVYSYVSSAHLSSSRINFFLVSNSLIQQISENTIHSIIISDHAPVSLTIDIPVQKKTSTRWRSNTSLLEGRNFLSGHPFLEISPKKLSKNLTFNTLGNRQSSHESIIISYSSHKKKKQQQLENTLEQIIIITVYNSIWRSTYQTQTTKNEIV